MFYYLRYSLIGILPTRIIKNFEKLSAAVYILCKKEILFDEIHLASQMLKEFANEFEEIYGSGAVTMNIHLLIHFKDMVENCGPLWCYSMFGFENNIGRLKKLVCGTTDVLIQIGNKYVVQAEDSISSNSTNEKLPSFHQRSFIDIEKKYLSALGIASDWYDNP